MLKQVGIRYKGVPTLAEMLYFDVIVVPRDPSQEDKAIYAEYAAERGLPPPDYSRNQDPQADAQIDYLRNNGVLADISAFKTIPDAASIWSSEWTRLTELATRAEDIVFRPQNAEGPRNSSPETSSGQEAIQLAEQIERLLILPYRRTVEANPNCQATTIFPGHTAIPCIDAHQRVLEVVIKRLPAPTKDTPLEAVIDFRSDAEAMRALRRLRLWMMRIARGDLEPPEIQAELEDLIDQYREHMRLHRLKYDLESVGSFVTVAFDVLENLTRFRFKGAADALFRLKANELALTEAELKAPGRVAAYVAMVEDRFLR